ncbi:MAG: hypothetical protein ACR2MY_03275 [Candidatus Dormibacteria bacterium]
MAAALGGAIVGGIGGGIISHLAVKVTTGTGTSEQALLDGAVWGVVIGVAAGLGVVGLPTRRRSDKVHHGE